MGTPRAGSFRFTSSGSPVRLPRVPAVREERGVGTRSVHCPFPFPGTEMAFVRRGGAPPLARARRRETPPLPKSQAQSGPSGGGLGRQVYRSADQTIERARGPECAKVVVDERRGAAYYRLLLLKLSAVKETKLN